MRRERLSHSQARVLAYMVDFFERNDQLPPCKHMRWHFGWESENAAVCHQKVLERKGYIEKNETGKYRFTKEAKQ